MAALAQGGAEGIFPSLCCLSSVWAAGRKIPAREAQPGACCDTVVCGFGNLQFEAASSIPIR